MPYSHSEDFEMKVHEFDIAIHTISWKSSSKAISAPYNSNFTGKEKSRECHCYFTSRVHRL